MARRLRRLGAAGDIAGRLDARVSSALPGLVSLSSLTSPLAVDYVQRVARPMVAMPVEAGVRLIARGYLAHLLIEEDPSAFAVDDIPVLGDLPPLGRRGQPPRDLLTRVVKASRRQFPVVCALPAPAWEGLVLATTGHTNEEWVVAAQPGSTGRVAAGLDTALVDGLMKTGWLLRQVDIHYRLEPERR